MQAKTKMTSKINFKVATQGLARFIDKIKFVIKKTCKFVYNN